MMRIKKAHNPLAEEQVLSFLARRFPNAEPWVTGNCYWMAIILSERFDGKIYYNPVENHFITKIGPDFYDARGLYVPTEETYLWDTYKNFDYLETQRILEGCIS